MYFIVVHLFVKHNPKIPVVVVVVIVVGPHFFHYLRENIQ